jgi:hypothetical protein
MIQCSKSKWFSEISQGEGSIAPAWSPLADRREIIKLLDEFLKRTVGSWRRRTPEGCALGRMRNVGEMENLGGSGFAFKRPGIRG